MRSAVPWPQRAMLAMVAVPFVGCGANAATPGAVVAVRALPCPVAPSAGVVGVAAVPPKAAPPAEGLGPKREQVVVEAFDCFSTLEEKRSESLRSWASGGPDGSAWNVEGAPLRCELKLSVPCAAAAALRVLGNTKLLAERKAALAVGESTIELLLPSAAWKKGLEASPGPYGVLLISIAGFATCSTATGGERLHFADAFLAGFAGGE